MRITTLCTLCFVLVLCSSIQAKIQAQSFRKHLAGPPGEFPFHDLPQPRTGGTLADSALIPVQFDTQNVDKDGNLVWETTLPVDTSKRVLLSVFSPIEEELSIHLSEPSAKEYKHIMAHVQETRGDVVREDSFGFGAPIPSTTYDIRNPQEGSWTLRMKAPVKPVKNLGLKTSAYLLFFTESPETVMAFVRDYKKLTSGSTVVMESFMFDSDQIDAQHAPNPDVPVETISFRGEKVKKAVLDLVHPDGTEESMEMNDDGFAMDTTAGDGLFTAHFTGKQAGIYRAQVKMQGVRGDGIEFFRTAQHLIRVADDHVEFNGKAWADATAEHESTIHIGVDLESNQALHQNYRAFAQVWATHPANNSMIPVAWIGGMSEISEHQNENVVSLYLNHGWLQRAGATFPIELRNVWMQETSGFIPVAESDIVSVATPSADVLEAVRATPVPSDITPEMRQGRRPEYLDRLARSTAGKTGKLMLVHGYCTSKPGPFSYEDFSDYVVFNSWDSNDPVDDFAQKILEFGQDLPSFGIFAHSQGGQASLHLHANYWSPLENAQASSRGEPVRYIQSIGTPYKGCSLAGTLAGIGDIFGVGCGKNFDLTHDGSKLWLAGIPADARKDVFYYTTQYKDKGLVKYCNLAANLALAWPNDGTVEYEYAQLEGGNNMGHRDGFCHTASMKWPPQCRDTERNKVVNLAAAR